MNYKALFTDFDGTLFANGKISDTNIQALNAARAAGKLVVFCSGRSWRSLAYYENLLGFDNPGTYGVAFNGGVAYAYTENGHEVLYRHTLETATAHEIIGKVKALALPSVKIFTYGENDDMFVEDGTKDAAPFSESRQIPITFVKDFSEVTGGIAKVVLFGENNELKKVAAQLADKHESVSSAAYLLEFLPPNVNKGTGLSFLAEHLNIQLSEMIAMGDEANDIPMIKKAGLGIAVANAIPPAKEAADIILTESCHEDAVSVVIHKYLL
ncbi:MAG: Cof-type HAD-IIB family hydrolase [Defluviitaleaceae bacterium]|nr:Cof-type HAD-IIB family hydrolase [Defluviitaleaceae bacterium]